MSDVSPWPPVRLAGTRAEGCVEVVATIDVTARGLDPGEAARHAGKVALLEALDLAADAELLDAVEVRGGHGRPPELVVGGDVAGALADRVAHLSLTHEGPVAAALVVVSLP